MDYFPLFFLFNIFYSPPPSLLPPHLLSPFRLVTNPPLPLHWLTIQTPVDSLAGSVCGKLLFVLFYFASPLLTNTLPSARSISRWQRITIDTTTMAATTPLLKYIGQGSNNNTVRYWERLISIHVITTTLRGGSLPKCSSTSTK